MEKKKTPKLVGYAVLTTIVAVLWIIYSIYQSASKKIPLSIPEEVLSPISPSLDKSAVEKIQGRVFFEEGELVETQAVGLPTPTATASAEAEEGTVSGGLSQ